MLKYVNKINLFFNIKLYGKKIRVYIFRLKNFLEKIFEITFLHIK